MDLKTMTSDVRQQYIKECEEAYKKLLGLESFPALCRNKLKLEYAIMLDGGHVAAIHAACSKINTNQRQYYAVRFL